MVHKVLPELRVSLLNRLVNDLNYKILYWDIETSLSEFYGWGTGEQYVNYKQIKKNKYTKIMTIQYMFEGDTKVSYLKWELIESDVFKKLPQTLRATMRRCLSDSILIKLNCLVYDDSKMVEEFIQKVLRSHPANKLFIIGQNHKAFDHKVLNERAKALRLTPPIQTSIKIDTFKHSKQTFKTASHSLDARSEQYGLGGKLHTDMNMWINILEGNKKVDDELLPYGLKDVTDLRIVFWNDLPYYEKLDAELEKALLQASAKCLVCEKRKERKYDIEECKVDRKAGFRCRNCNNTFTLFGDEE